MAYRNPQRQKEAASKHYQANKAKMIAKAAKHNSAQRIAIKASILEYLLSHPCVDCNEKDPIVLEFDHRVGVEKRFNIGDAARTAYSLKTLMNEIAKCDVRCANCHRRVTYYRASHNSKKIERRDD